jgi:6-phosphogluconolactonase
MNIVRTNNFVVEAADTIAQAAGIGGEFRLGLCGGNTPRAVYAELAKRPLAWSEMRITFGDERCVGPEDAQSNYRMARESLLANGAIPEANVLRLRGELEPETAAAEYEKSLRDLAGGGRYVHDLLLLGLGDDGHTASLFPGTAALQERDRDVIENFVPKFQAHRLTMTFPLINAARRIYFLVNDPAKEEIVNAVIAGDERFPASLVRPADGEVTWIIGSGS